MSGTDLNIKLIRSRDHTKDDDITFRRRSVPEAGYLLRYVDGLVPKKVWIQEKSIIEVMKYIERMFLFLKNDADPFIGIQVDIPSTPLIFIEVNNLTDDIKGTIMHSIYDYLMKPPSYFNQ